MKVSIEILAHFQCENCNRWFSIGDPLESMTEKDDLCCPYCGDGVADHGDIEKAVSDKFMEGT